MTDPTHDHRAAERLGTVPGQVAFARDRWNDSSDSVIVKTLYLIRIEDQEKELTARLRKCSAEELKGLQGALDSLERVKGILTERLTP